MQACSDFEFNCLVSCAYHAITGFGGEGGGQGGPPQNVYMPSKKINPPACIQLFPFYFDHRVDHRVLVCTTRHVFFVVGSVSLPAYLPTYPRHQADLNARDTKELSLNTGH